jgi:hypothetical protein
MRIVGPVAIFVALALAFQNCSPTRGKTTGEPSTTTQMNGNGGTYDGKPAEGKYVRQHSEGCSESGTIGVLQVTSSLSKVTADICTSMDYSIGFSDTRLNYSQYNRDYIGFNSAIFEAEAVFTATPEPVELWCRHVQPDSGVDLVVKSNGQGNLYRGDQLGTPKANVFPRTPLTVQLTKTSSSISVTSSTVNGSVDLSSKNNGTFAGQLTISGANLSVDCRVLSSEPAVYTQPANILAMYQMDGTVGPLLNNSVLQDSSQNSFSADLHNLNGTGAARISAGRYSQALHLGGTDDYVDFSALATKVGTDLTVSMYLRPDLKISDDKVAFAVNTNIGGNVIKIGTGMCSGTGDQSHLSLELGNNCYDTGKVVVDGQWHAVSASISLGRATLYLDGVQVENQALVHPFSTTDIWSLGTDYDTSLKPGDFWLGDIDEVTIWSVALPGPP